MARDLIRLDGDQLVVSLRAFGKEYRRRPFQLRGIEEVEIKPSTSEHAHRRRKKRDTPSPTGNQLVIRSDRQQVDARTDRSQQSAQNVSVDTDHPGISRTGIL